MCVEHGRDARSDVGAKGALSCPRSCVNSGAVGQQAVQFGSSQPTASLLRCASHAASAVSADAAAKVSRSVDTISAVIVVVPVFAVFAVMSSGARQWSTGVP